MADEAGEVVSCPQCGTEVMQKSMIPVLAAEGGGHRYLCRECARALIPAEGTAATEEATPTRAAPTEEAITTDQERQRQD